MILTIYLIGYVLAYLALKKYAVTIGGTYWTKGKRLTALLISILSWLTFLACIVAVLISVFVNYFESDEDASW